MSKLLLLDDLLRGRLGFDGVVVSDALDMRGAAGRPGGPAVAALQGGCDLLCLGSYTDEQQLARIEEQLMTALRDGTLPEERLADAGRRVRALATSLPPPAAAPDEPVVLAAEEVASCFAVSPAARASLAEPGGWTPVRLETRPDNATGWTPWGPFALLPEPAATADATTTPVDLPPGRLVLVGRGNHRYPWVRELVDRCRRERPGTLVVDMGWPAGAAYADVATYGGTRAQGAALLHLLGLSPGR